MAVELAPLRAMLDTIHDDLPTLPSHNAYVLGELGDHNVVAAVLPSTGNNISAIAVTQLLQDFPSIRFVLLVGIGGGVPGEEHADDIRLGDVVVSKPTDRTGGVVQFDRGKRLGDNSFHVTGHLNKPPHFLVANVEKLKARHEQEGGRTMEFVSDMLKRNPAMSSKYSFPNPESDQLFESDYSHVGGATCHDCDPERLRQRPQRASGTINIHYGTIGSSNSVVRDAVKRDGLKRAHNLLCVEMEAAGVLDAFPCLVIRGICDYADSHKNKQWQPFAAAVAAAYAKELLLTIPAAQQSHMPASLSSSLRGFEPDSIPVSSGGGRGYNTGNDDTAAEKAAKSKKLLQSLTFERMDARLLNITSALPQTCKWIFEEEKFKMWMAREKVDEHHGFLWIKGKPGSGKSTIMKQTLEMARSSRSNGIIISYFFNARAPGHLEKSSVGMYRSLVHQLLQGHPPLQEMFTDRFAAKVRDDSVDDWTMAELQGLMMDILENLGGRPLSVFIDALDEGDEDDIRNMIAFLEELNARAVEHDIPLKTCLSSRHYPHISIRNGLSLVMEYQDGHKNDIEMYVQRKLSGDEGPRMEELRSKVCRKSARVFLWVVLVIPMLNKSYDRGQVAEMERHLDEIPESLDRLFVNILAKNTEDIDLTVLLLQWVLFSARPLSPIELYLAIQSRSASSCAQSAVTLSKDTLDRYLLNCSRGLTEVSRTGTPFIQFIHETVRDFLLLENGLSKIDPCLAGNVIGLSHQRLHTACILHFDLRLPDRKNSDSETVISKIRPAQLQQKFPFSEYAVNCMFLHADSAEAHGIPQTELLKRFQDNNGTRLLKWLQYRNSFQRYKARHYSAGVSLLYILAEQNLPNLAKSLIEDNVDVNACGERYGNALQAACAVGCEQMAQLLIEHGANPVAVGGEHDYALCAAIHHRHDSIVRLLLKTQTKLPLEVLENRFFLTVSRGYLYGIKVLLDAGATTSCMNSRQESPLYLAIRGRRLDVVDLLIRRGADVDTKCGPYGNALLAAIAHGHEPIARLLIANGMDVNAGEVFYGKALNGALRYGHVQIARLLVENGADVNAPCLYYGNPLRSAVSQGLEQTVRLLIEKGADVTGQGDSHGEVLKQAAVGGNERIVRLLIENGASVNSKRSDRWSALQAASDAGREPIVRILIQHGADVNAQCGDYGSALQAAAAAGHEKIGRLLIGHGAEVNAQGGYYGNAIQAAAAGGHEQMVRLLVRKGADIHAQGGQHGNALQAAVAGGHKIIVRQLIELGVDVNAQGGQHGNALQAAAAYGYEDVVRWLINEGADVNARGGHWDTALRAANICGRKEIARILIAKGAE